MLKDTHFFFFLSSPVEARLRAEMDREEENAAFPTDHERKFYISY